MRVLVVDDDEMNRYVLCALLESRGHDVDRATSGTEALRTARATLPDLLLTDVFMPDMDGYQLCIRWQKDAALCSVPFVFYTAMYTDPADERFARRLGADAFLTKPMDPDTLVATLERAVGLRSAGPRRAPVPPDADETDILREYGNRLVDTLEKKVSELKATNVLLEGANHTLTALVDSAPLGIVLLHLDGRIRMWNPAAERIFGWTETEVIGHEVNPLFDVTDDGLCPALEPIRAGRPFKDHEETRARKDGSEVALSISAAPLYDGESNMQGCMAIVTDITDRKRDEAELKHSVDRLERAIDGSIRVIAKIVETRDPYTAGHEERVSRLAVAIAREMGLSEPDVSGLHTAATVHDLGKISVPAEILTKPGRLTEPEWAIIKVHPMVGYEILQYVDFDWPIADVVAQHHERMDGSGYPAGLSGDEIRLEARILAVADVVEAMSSHRPYRPALGLEQALAEIREYSGDLYDDDVVAACEAVMTGDSFAF